MADLPPHLACFQNAFSAGSLVAPPKALPSGHGLGDHQPLAASVRFSLTIEAKTLSVEQ